MQTWSRFKYLDNALPKKPLLILQTGLQSKLSQQNIPLFLFLSLAHYTDIYLITITGRCSSSHIQGDSGLYVFRRCPENHMPLYLLLHKLSSAQNLGFHGDRCNHPRNGVCKRKRSAVRVRPCVPVTPDSSRCPIISLSQNNTPEEES